MALVAYQPTGLQFESRQLSGSSKVTKFTDTKGSKEARHSLKGRAKIRNREKFARKLKVGNTQHFVQCLNSYSLQSVVLKSGYEEFP